MLGVIRMGIGRGEVPFPPAAHVNDVELLAICLHGLRMLVCHDASASSPASKDRERKRWKKLLLEPKKIESGHLVLAPHFRCGLLS